MGNVVWEATTIIYKALPELTTVISIIHGLLGSGRSLNVARSSIVVTKPAINLPHEITSAETAWGKTFRWIGTELVIDVSLVILSILDVVNPSILGGVKTGILKDVEIVL